MNEKLHKSKEKSLNTPSLNKRQLAILDFIKSELQIKGYPPAVREIMDAVNLKSPSTVHGHLNTLEKKGYIRRDPLKPRAIEVLDGSRPASAGPAYISAPVYDALYSTIPLPNQNKPQNFIPVPQQFLRSRKPVYMLRINDDSMMDVGIREGDFLVVEESNTAKNGEIIVALIDNQATVKTLYREPNHFRLQPANKSFQPIFTDKIEIIGKPFGIFRNFS